MTEKNIFTDKGIWEQAIVQQKEKYIDKGTDQLIVFVVGEPNSGKTAFSLLTMNYVLGDIKPENIAQSHNEWKKIHTHNPYLEQPPKKFIIHDEGRESFDRSKYNSSENKEAKNILNKYRKYKNIVFVNFQQMMDLEPYVLAMDSTKYIVRCFKEDGNAKGVAHIYNVKDMRKMFSQPTSGKPKFTGWDPSVDYVEVSYPDPKEFIPNRWDKYEKSAIQKLNNGENENNNNEFKINKSQRNELTIKIPVSTEQIFEACLKRNDNSIRIQELADNNLYSRYSTAEKGVKKLKKLGFLKKKSDRQTNAQYRYELTSSGKKLYEVIKEYNQD